MRIADIEQSRDRVLDAAARNTSFIEKAVRFQEMDKMSGFVEVSLHGHSFVMFVSRNDDAVALRLLWNHTYETLSTKIWMDKCKKAKSIADVGAHTGVYSILASLSNPKARIVAIEPHPLNFARLVVNVRENDIFNVQIDNSAVSDSEGFESFGSNTQQWYLSTGGRLSHPSPTSVYIARTIMLDEYDGLDLVKMDTEGNELKCLKGMKETLKRKPDILFECTSDKEEIFDFLKTAGYKIFSINDKTSEVNEVQKPLMNNEVYTINYLATHGA